MSIFEEQIARLLIAYAPQLRSNIGSTVGLDVSEHFCRDSVSLGQLCDVAGSRLVHRFDRCRGLAPFSGSVRCDCRDVGGIGRCNALHLFGRGRAVLENFVHDSL